jgi:uncharacterized protein HemY
MLLIVAMFLAQMIIFVAIFTVLRGIIRNVSEDVGDYFERKRRQCLS